jgi:hypothetical protein
MNQAQEKESANNIGHAMVNVVSTFVPDYVCMFSLLREL